MFIIMKKCAICLEYSPFKRIKSTGKTLWKTGCCKINVHYECQVAWGNECIICSKQLKTVSTAGFKYIPEAHELTQREIEENRRAMQELNLDEPYYVPLLQAITTHLAEVFITEDEDDIYPLFE